MLSLQGIVIPENIQIVGTRGHFLQVRTQYSPAVYITIQATCKAFYSQDLQKSTAPRSISVAQVTAINMAGLSNVLDSHRIVKFKCESAGAMPTARPNANL